MNAIVVADRNWAIGRDNRLLFSLPTDMRHFRSLTLGGTVILGRKTLESFPGGNPLPKRRNIVITRDRTFSRAGAEVVHSIGEALQAAAGTEEDKLWVIGGGSVYSALLPRCRRVYLTQVESTVEAADTFFPNLDQLPGWRREPIEETVEENGYVYHFVTYVNTAL